MIHKPIPGKMFRVYDPPMPLENGQHQIVEVGGVAYSFRDYDAQKVEIGPDGTITLHSVELTGEELDVRSGKMMQGVRQTILAIIDVDGHLRAETIDTAQDGGSALD